MLDVLVCCFAVCIFLGKYVYMHGYGTKRIQLPEFRFDSCLTTIASPKESR